MARRVAGLCLLCLLTAGCAKKPPVEVEIGGTAVDASGKALAGLVLRFHPDDEVNKRGRSLACLVQPDGSFTGKCLPGRYKVTLTKPTAGAGGGDPGAGVTAAPEKGKPEVPSRYSTPATTPWNPTIPEAGTKELKLKVE